MGKKKKKKPVRGSGFSVTMPTEPLAGEPKTTPIMAVMVQDEGALVLEHELRVGDSREFRVGGTAEAFMQRIGPAPDSDMFVLTSPNNRESVTVEYQHALAGPQKQSLGPGSRRIGERRAGTSLEIYSDPIGSRILCTGKCCTMWARG